MKTKERATVPSHPIEEPKTPEGALARGRALMTQAEAAKTPVDRRAARLEACGRFRTAIAMRPEFEEAYAWLAHALRLIGQGAREAGEEDGDAFLRQACAVAWEAKTKTPAAALSGRSRQEVKVLVAWLRATKHLSVADAEAEMESLRARHLAEALGA